MKQLGGLALVAMLFAGSAAADLVSLEFNPYGDVVFSSYDATTGNGTSEVIASVDGTRAGSLQVPGGALSMEYLGSQYDAWNQVMIHNGHSAFESNASDFVVPFFDVLQGYMLADFSNPFTYSVISAGNAFWDFDVAAEATGSTDYGMNFLAFQLSRWELIDVWNDPVSGTINTSIYQNFNFLISLADLPSSAADVELRSADDVRALFASLNGEVGYFNSSVGFQIDRCESNSCSILSNGSYTISGQVAGHGEGQQPIEVPVPATLLLLALGLPLALRRKSA